MFTECSSERSHVKSLMYFLWFQYMNNLCSKGSNALSVQLTYWKSKHQIIALEFKPRFVFKFVSYFLHFKEKFLHNFPHHRSIIFGKFWLWRCSSPIKSLGNNWNIFVNILCINYLKSYWEWISTVSIYFELIYNQQFVLP